MTLPPYQTASGVSDIFAHCLERYFSDTPDCELTDRMLEAVMLTMLKEGRRVMKNPNDYEARANIMWAAMVAQNNITGVGRAQDWGTHHMDNEIGINYGASHGAGLALLFPYWMEYAIKAKGPEKFVKFATRIFGCQNDFEHPEVTAMEGVKLLRRLFRAAQTRGIEKMSILLPLVNRCREAPQQSGCVHLCQWKICIDGKGLAVLQRAWHQQCHCLPANVLQHNKTR